MPNKYINRFFSLNTAPELLPFFVGKKGRAAKEVTESFAMHSAATETLALNPTNPDIFLIVVGDGVRPRTASVFAYLTKWTCLSIDPQMNTGWWWKHVSDQYDKGQPIQRLAIARTKIENMRIDCEGKAVCLVFPHSHAHILSSLPSLCNYQYIHLITMPCCYGLENKLLARKFTLPHHMVTYVDEHVQSPKNQVYIWQYITPSDVTQLLA